MKAMRLRTLPLALSAIFTAWALATSQAEVNGVLVALLFSTTIFLQILSNFANDYGDFQNGADNAARVGPPRAVQSGEISPNAMKTAVILMSVLSFLSGISLLWVAFGDKGQFVTAALFLVLGLFAIAAAIKYTAGKNPYGYKGLGDLFVFFFFGVVAVGGSIFLLKGNLAFIDFLGMWVIGALSTAVLNLNNLRDIENDKNAGKVTLVVKMGFEKGKIYHYFLVGSAIVFLTLIALMLKGKFDLLPLLVVPFLAKNLVFVKRTTNPVLLDSQLKVVALLTFAYSVLLMVAQRIG